MDGLRHTSILFCKVIWSGSSLNEVDKVEQALLIIPFLRCSIHGLHSVMWREVPKFPVVDKTPRNHTKYLHTILPDAVQYLTHKAQIVLAAR